jgi:hypothetical protein
MKNLLVILLLLTSVIALAQSKTKEERQEELDARKSGETTEEIKGNELAGEVDVLYISLNLFNKPFSFSGKKLASVVTGNGKAKGITGETGILYFNSNTHAINYLASFGWELISHELQNAGITYDKYLFKRMSNGTLPPLQE